MPVQRIAEFDTWRPGYSGATVTVYRAGSSVLADIWTDEALTVPATNPQVLIGRVAAGVSYGKFSAPVYTDQAIELRIDNIDTTGTIRPPITSTDGEDVSGALVLAAGSVVSHSLADRFARVLYVQDYGEFLGVGETGASSATNTTTIIAAIGAAGAQGGGIVLFPPGVYDFVSFTIPEGVILCGCGEGATFLQSTLTGPVVTLSGLRCGLAYMTLDGVSLEPLSIGVFTVASDQSQFYRVTIKRFEDGLYFRGGERGNWIDLKISDCVNGAKLHGDLNAGAGGGGEAFRGNRWQGGSVSFCTGVGVEMKREDADCSVMLMDSVTFNDNTGPAVRVEGARSITLVNPIFRTNAVNYDIKDGTPVDEDNTIAGFLQLGGSIVGGEVRLNGTLEDVIFDGVELADVDIYLTSPLNNVIAQDCREDSAVTINGASTNWLRRKTTDVGATFGLTSGNAATKAWAITLESGQQVLLEAKIIGRQRNGTNRATYWIANSGRRAPATLAYDTQTVNFTVGNILTGQTSGATARIIADSDSGTTGTLSLIDVDGVFVDNEIITDGASGSATANGGITEGTVSVGTGNDLRTAEETDTSWAVAFVANGPEIELRVTGASSQTVEWICDVTVTST